MKKRAEGRREKERVLAAELYARRNETADWEDAPIAAHVHSKRAVVTSLRLPVEEFVSVQRAAKSAGQTVSEFIRSAIATKLRGSLVLNGVQIATGSAETRSQATVLAPTLKGGNTENPGPDHMAAIPLYANLVP